MKIDYYTQMTVVMIFANISYITGKLPLTLKYSILPFLHIQLIIIYLRVRWDATLQLFRKIKNISIMYIYLKKKKKKN